MKTTSLSNAESRLKAALVRLESAADEAALKRASGAARRDLATSDAGSGPATPPETRRRDAEIGRRLDAAIAEMRALLGDVR